MYKVKIGAITKEVSEGSLKWYIMAGWRVVGETNTKKTTTKQGKVQKKSR